MPRNQIIIVNCSGRGDKDVDAAATAFGFDEEIRNHEIDDRLRPRRDRSQRHKFSVELNSVNRKQSDIVINLPRDLAELEPRIRQTINENISRGRTNVSRDLSQRSERRAQTRARYRAGALLSRSDARVAKGAQAPGEITIGTILQAPGVMRVPEEAIECRRSVARDRARAAGRARRVDQNARTRRQTSGQGLDPPAESDAQTTQGNPRRCIPRW